MPTFEEQQIVLHSPFDIETHKKTFINYLEAVITSDGVIHYAIPSHNEFCYKMIMKDFGFETRDELYSFINKRNVDITQFCKVCMVWNNRIIGYVNNDILRSLQKLIKNNLLTI